MNKEPVSRIAISKALVLCSLILFCCHLTIAQSLSGKGITVSSEFFKNPEMLSLLLFQGIDYHKVTFRGSELKGKDYSIVAKEIWNGELKKIDTVLNSLRTPLARIGADSLQFKVIASAKPENKLKVLFMFDGFGVQRFFESTGSDEYSLREIAKYFKIVPEKKFYALAYILPYEQDGYKMYCAVESSGEDVEAWGKHFGIKHYIIFEMRFF